MTAPLNDIYADPVMAADFERHAADGSYNAHYDRPAVLRLAGDVDGLDVLDAACGPGFYLAELASRGARVTGFDASQAMVDLATKRAPAAAPQLASLDDRLPYPDERFDLVVCALAIHYAHDRLYTLQEFHRVLRPGGAAVISTQHPTSDWLRKGGSYFAIQLETDIWKAKGSGRLQDWAVTYWREPITSLSEAAYQAGFLIERLLEPQPAPSMQDRDPDTYAELSRDPAFLVLRLLKPSVR